jgi:hypothetical protein
MISHEIKSVIDDMSCCALGMCKFRIFKPQPREKYLHSNFTFSFPNSENILINIFASHQNYVSSDQCHTTLMENEPFCLKFEC